MTAVSLGGAGGDYCARVGRCPWVGPGISAVSLGGAGGWRGLGRVDKQRDGGEKEVRGVTETGGPRPRPQCRPSTLGFSNTDVYSQLVNHLSSYIHLEQVAEKCKNNTSNRGRNKCLLGACARCWGLTLLAAVSLEGRHSGQVACHGPREVLSPHGWAQTVQPWP